MAIPQTSTILPHAALTEGAVKTMFVSKPNNAVALATIVFVLMAGTDARHHVAMAGQPEEPRGKQPSSRKQEQPKMEEPKDRVKIPQVPLTKRTFRIDLRLTKEKNGQRKVLACPRKITLEGKETRFRMGPSYLYTFGHSSSEDFVMGPSVHMKVYSGEGGKLCFLMTVNQPTLGIVVQDVQDVTVKSRSIRILRKIELGQLITAKLRYGDKNQSVLEVAAAVQEAEKDDKDWDANTTEARGSGYPSQQPTSNRPAKKHLDASTIAAAEKDLKIAEFYHRTGPLASARFYYELICNRYPQTIYMERGKKRLAELKEQKGEPQVWVGQIFIIGNEKTPDIAILEQVPFFPGGLLNYSDLRVAERNLSRLKGLKSNPKVTVLDLDGDSEFKDIEIRIEEK